MGKTVTTTIFIDKYHPKADGTCAVSIRVTYNGTKRHYPTKYKLTETEFSQLFTPKPKEPYKSILQALVLEEEKAKDIIDNLGKHFSFTLFEKKFARKVGDDENICAL